MDQTTKSELPHGVRLEDVHGTPAVVVETPACRAIVHLDGAHLTSWVPTGEDDVLWTSPDAVYAEGEPIRGGIPLIGPWFGPGVDGRSVPAHGWLRRHRWELIDAEHFHGWADEDADVVHSDAVALSFALDGADPSAEEGEGVRAVVHYVLAADHLQVRLEITAGSSPLELEAALHTYLAVGDVRTVRLEGLSGARYLDNREGLREDVQEEEPRLTGPIDRVYDVATPVIVHDEVLERAIEITARSANRTVVWNPWSDGAAGMEDMPLDGWRQFLCVETAVAKDGAISLGPRQCHTLQARYDVSSD